MAGRAHHATRGYQGDENGDGCPSWDNAKRLVDAANAIDRSVARDAELIALVNADLNPDGKPIVSEQIRSVLAAIKRVQEGK